MRNALLACAVFSVASMIFLFASWRKPVGDINDLQQYKTNNKIACSPDISSLSAKLNGLDIPPMPGAGNYSWKINTKEDSAQFYFNQGLNMYYGFHIIEAIASFKKSLRFDSAQGLTWWALALSYGPNINDVGYSASPEALEGVENALRHSNVLMPVEKDLIAAMRVRYSDDTLLQRNELNERYALEMEKIYKKYPRHPEVLALYADALMLQHPWDLWTPQGTPKPWTLLIRKVLEELLILSPDHPGGNHYYIHVMEASPFAYKALPSADKLGSLTPGLSHMVHMPSHIYLRMGQFAKGSAINEKALQQFQQYVSLFPVVAENAFLYQLHNQHMQANCALLAGRYAYALEAARQLQLAIDTSWLSAPAPMGAAVQYVYATPMLIQVHFQKWDELKQIQKPGDHQVYANILYQFGQGMAAAGSKEPAIAARHLAALQALMKADDLKIPFGAFSSALEGAAVAEALLNGFISMKQNNVKAAIASFSKAVKLEEQMVYNEPRDWILNPKQYLGRAYLAAKQWDAAAQTFRADLKVNADNVWSLYGLEHALRQQGKVKEAVAIKNQFKKAAVLSDVFFKEFLY